MSSSSLPARRLQSLETGWRDPQFLLKRHMFADVIAARSHAKGRMLDVGCGNRPYLEAFDASITGYVGVDPDVRGSSPDVAAVAGALPFSSGAFDTVFSVAVIEHVPEPAEMLAEVFRVLAPGGQLILLAPQYWRLHEEPHDYFRFTKYGLAYLLEQAGFAVVETKAQGGAWSLAGQAACGALEHRPRLRWLIPLVNLASAAFDRWRPDSGDTMSLLVVARK